MHSATIQTLIAASAAVNQNGSAILADQLTWVSAQVVTTGTSTGTLKLQASNDVVTQPSSVSSGTAAPTHWFDITSATVSVSAAGTVGIVKTEICYQWIRAVWTETNAAAGTISVNIQVAG